MTSISDQILSRNAPLLEQMLAHPFVTQISDNTLPKEAYHRYLVFEGAFVETAISIFALATLKAPDLKSKRWLIGVQQALANDQMAYFEETFEALGIDADILVPSAVTEFDQGMLEIAQRGDFLDIVTAMFAAEWMYLQWCRRAAGQTMRDTHVRRWVDLHADADFAAQAHWLKDTIDRHAHADDLERLAALFGRVTELEIAFHSAPFETAQENTDA